MGILYDKGQNELALLELAYMTLQASMPNNQHVLMTRNPKETINLM